MRTYGEKTEDGIEIKIAITQSELALLSGGSRQHINQILKKWNDQNIIRSGAYLTVIDQSALEARVVRYVGAACNLACVFMVRDFAGL